jgi:hypothetical protein
VRRLLLVLALLLAAVGPAAARVLLVGPGEALARPSDAARLAKDGDEVRIAPGTYYDCAIWRASRLTIVGIGAATGPGVVLTDLACAGKASFVIGGDDVVVRGITFARIRVADHNGAGIRAEGGDLTVEDCAFIDNQAGILTAGRGGAVLRVRRSRFEQTGACAGGRCTGALMVGGWAGLEVSDSRFSAPRAGLAIQSDAARVTLRGNRIEGDADGLVRLGLRGPVVLEQNVFVQSGAGEAVLLTGGDGPVAVLGNSYLHQGGGGIMVRNWSGAEPVMQDNVVAAGDTALSTSGAWWNSLRLAAHAVYDPARALAGKVKGKAVELGGRAVGKLRQLLPF